MVDFTGGSSTNSSDLGKESTLPVVMKDGTTTYEVLQPDLVTLGLQLPCTRPLSVLECPNLSLPTPGIVLFYDAPLDLKSPQATALSTGRLLQSLQTTLNAYPEWAGRLHPTISEGPSLFCGEPSKRGCRLALTLTGSPLIDPGLSVTVRHHPRSLQASLPCRGERGDCWSADIQRVASVVDIPRDVESLRSRTSYNIAVQLNRFACGGVCIAVKGNHGIMDAHSLATFCTDWAAVNRDPRKVPARKWRPEALDAKGGGLVAPEPDEVVLDLVEGVPQTSTFHTHPGFPEGEETSSVILHFTCEEVMAIWRDAVPAAPAPGIRVPSKQNALLAHIRTCVARARTPNVLPGRTYIASILCDLRGSLGLPPDHVGASVALLALRTESEGIAAIAREITDGLAKFCSKDVEQAPWTGTQPPWLDANNVLTSWVRAGFSKVDFGWGEPSVLAPQGTPVDGFSVLVETPTGGLEMGLGRKLRRQHWLENGVDLTVQLAPAAMERLLADPELRRYRRARSARIHKL